MSNKCWIMAEVTNNEGMVVATSVYTFNVRGMRDKTKRARLFSYFKRNMNGIIFLQETYSVPGDLERWTKEWGGKIYLNNGTSHSRGVAILVPKHMECNIETIETHDNGRLIIITGTFNKHDITLMNIYAPIGDKQLQFLESITQHITEHSNNLIIGGDFNTYLSELDKYGKFDKLSEYAN